MLWMVPRGYFRDCPGQRNGEGVVVLVLVCVLFKDTQVGLLLEPRKTRGPRLSLLWLSTGAHAPPRPRPGAVLGASCCHSDRLHGDREQRLQSPRRQHRFSQSLPHVPSLY